MYHKIVALAKCTYLRIRGQTVQDSRTHNVRWGITMQQSVPFSQHYVKLQGWHLTRFISSFLVLEMLYNVIRRKGDTPLIADSKLIL